MNNYTFIKQVALPSAKDGVACDYCGGELANAVDAAIYMTTENVLKYIHASERASYDDTFTAKDEDEQERSSATPAAASSEDMACPYCGITVNPKDGIAFKDASNPNYSLGNHKKWCASKPPIVVPAPTPTEAPAPVAPTPVAPRSTTPPPSPSIGMPVEYVTAIATQGERARAKFLAKQAPPNMFWNERVRDEIAPIVRAAYADKQPIAFIGASGTGKTVYTHAFAREVGAHHMGSLNFSEQMRMDSLFGQIIPTGQGTIGWNDGILTKAARWGGIALLEEFSRSGEGATRAMSALDQVERGMYLPENPFEQEVDVHPDMFVMITMNPVGLGYTTKELDVAMKSRFLLIEANFPFADERKVIEPLLGADRADRLTDMFETLRLGGKIYPNTRDLVQVARLLWQKVSLARAVEVAVIGKLPEKFRDGAKQVTDAYSI